MFPTLRLALLTAAIGAAALPAPPALAQSGDDTVLQAREALRRKDKTALAAARLAINGTRHPLAQWVEYWELTNRLPDAQQPELDTFWVRWADTYVEDRLRNDWLLELGKRRDWANFRAEFPRFRMNDDREVTCYALLTQHLDGQDVRNAARAAWHAQRDLDDGCNLLARTLVEARALGADDAWQEARLSVEANRPRAARAAIGLALAAGRPPGTAAPAVDPTGDVLDNPARFLTRRAEGGAAQNEMTLLALMRLAANDPADAASQIEAATQRRLPPGLAATAWAHAAKQAALKQLPTAPEYARNAWRLWEGAHRAGVQPPWSDELLAWHVRAALRQPTADKTRWTLVARAIEAMTPAEQRDAAWVYWNARATQALAPAGTEGDAQRTAARTALESIAPQMGFYGKLATEALGARVTLPPAPPALTTAERENPRNSPGFQRALKLVAIGLRNEGVREWNYMLRGLSDRDLMAAAQLACEREVWDRCINTSERTRADVDVAQRFPLPYRDQVIARAKEAGLDPAVVYGLIRQESRFIADIRSSVGAAGLMQLMPATAQWTARKMGVPYRPELITDPSLNLQLGAYYLRRVLDDFGGSLAMAAAAYNAGPGRPRKWREGGGVMEPAAWAETIPFNETRDYVKKVLSNSVYYAALLGTPAPTLAARLGPPIGPRDPGAASPDREIP